VSWDFAVLCLVAGDAVVHLAGAGGLPVRLRAG